MEINRHDSEPPLTTAEWGWRYHHLGIPTNGPIENESYLPEFKLFVGGFSASPYGIEWMRFEADSPVHELIQRVPHVAFEVDNLDVELRRNNFNIITKPNSPALGTRVTMIAHNVAPVELIEFSNRK